LALRVRAKTSSHFGISSSDHFWQILKTKNLEIGHYYSAFCSSKPTKPKLNLSAKNVNLFLREPLDFGQIVTIRNLKTIVTSPNQGFDDFEIEDR